VRPVKYWVAAVAIPPSSRESVLLMSCLRAALCADHPR
jgi:hypothetical protein